MFKRLENESGFDHSLHMVGPAEAAALLEHNTYDGQRKLKSYNIDLFSQEMLAGKFLTTTIVMMKGPDGVVQIADGQNRLHAVIKSGTSVPFYIDHYDCDTEKDKVELYARIDVGARRGVTDLISSKRHTYPAPLNTYPIKFLGRCATACSHNLGGKYDLHGFDDRHVDAKANLLPKRKKAVVWLNSMWQLAGTDRKECQELKIMSPMLATYDIDSDLADEFWAPVCSGEGLVKGTVQHRLANAITSKVYIGRGSDGEYRRTYYPARICVDAWNLWMTGQQGCYLNVRKPEGPPMPELVRVRKKPKAK